MTQIILSDENCEGQAEVIFQRLNELGYVELLSITFKTFRDTDLPYGADDETVWRFC